MKQIKKWAAGFMLYVFVIGLRILRSALKNWAKRDSVLILPPTSPGSLGDQAILRASVGHLLTQGVKQVVIISYLDTDDWQYIQKTSRVQIYPMQDYFSYSAWRRRFQLLLLASHQDHFFFFGTDQMDGFYHEEFLLQQLELLRMAALTGVPCTIVGFSYNKAPTPASVKAVQELPENVQLCVRDPASFRRVEQHIHRKLTLTADVAFLLRPSQSSDTVKNVLAWLEGQKREGRVLVGINLNYLFLNQVAQMQLGDLVQIYLAALKEIQASHGNVSFFLLPHDARGDVSDFALSHALIDQLPDEDKNRFACLPESIQADEIKAVCGELDIVLSARMHVAIACLGQGTPVACMTYQDKFEGLYEHFQLNHMTISPDLVLKKGELARFFLPLIQNRNELRAQIQRELPRIQELAQANLQR